MNRLSTVTALLAVAHGSAARAQTNPTVLQNRHVFIDVANHDGIQFPNVDGFAYGSSNPAYANSYYIKADGGGVNETHISATNSVSAGGPIELTSTSLSAEGDIYLTNTGGRGFDNDMLLLVGVKPPIRDDFAVTITASGYRWTPFYATPPSVGVSPMYGQPGYPTYVDGEPIYVAQGVDATFGRADFIYGPQAARPGGGNSLPNTPCTMPLYNGQDTTDSSTAEYLMFVDLKVGNLKNDVFSSLGLVDYGAVHVHYRFENMDSVATLNSYGWASASNQAEGINWSNCTGNTSAPCSGPSGFVLTYTGPDLTPPIVIQTTPANGTTDFPPNASYVTASFSEPINKDILLASDFTVTSDAGVHVPGAVTYDAASRTVMFRPAALQPSTSYTVSVSGVQDLAGNPMASASTWIFATAAGSDNAPPSVIGVAPAANATDVPINTQVSPITAQFDEAIDTLTLGPSSFYLTGPAGQVTGTVTYDAATHTAILTTSALLFSTPNTPAVYTAHLTGIADLSGNRAPDYSWSFTTQLDNVPPTVIALDPKSTATDVPPEGSTVSATFSEAITWPSGQFLVFAPSNEPVVGALSYDPATHVVTFTPAAALSYGTTYTVDVSGMTDLTGNAMASDRIWSFKTAVGSYRPESGDLNGDGQCTADDAGIELDIALGNVSAASQQMSGGDLAPVVNGSPRPDGKIDVGDVVILLRKVAGLVTW